MASAISFLVNANPAQDVNVLDSFIDPHVFDQILIENLAIILANSQEIIIDARYNLRPDLLAYENYGTNFYYPVILVANKLGSIFQFKAEYLNNKCLLPSLDVVQSMSLLVEQRRIETENKENKEIREYNE